MSTIAEVAEQVGVSASTARRALSEPHLLAPETLARVLAAIEELGYEPNQTASALRRGRTLCIGLIVGDILEPLFAHLTRSIGRAVREAGYTMLVAENEYDATIELRSLKQFYGQKVSGLILRPGYGQTNIPFLKRMRTQGTVVLEIDYVSPNSPFSSIMLDNQAGVEEIIDYLVAFGHERIAAVGRQYSQDLHEDRVHYFKKALCARGLDVVDAYDVKTATEQEAYAATFALMALPEPPTAFMGVTGTCGRGVFRALRELNLSIPEDVSLVTFDNDAWTSLFPPGVDAFEQPVEVMCKAAIAYVLEEIAQPTNEIVRGRFPGTLIKRGSCAAPKK